MVLFNNLHFVILITSIVAYNQQPRLYVRNGDLHFTLPSNKRVYFDASDLYVNGIEVLKTLRGAQNATRLVQTYKLFISTYNSRMDDLEYLVSTTARPSINVTYSKEFNDSINLKFRRINRRLTVFQRTFSNLQVLLTKDECASNPCKNGGNCLDMFNGFLCQCSNGWEGPTCEKDINECARFVGTDLGCQNGGTCQNLPGTYQCLCHDGWIGIHCNRKPSDCSSGSTQICGHGTCVPQNNEAGYKCLCDAGWSTDGVHLGCTADVDECKMNHPPCSVNPLVSCTNVLGSFYCQHCPPGYTGNGYYCADINECDIFNGGCSVNPRVECINLQGSSKCAPCPSGYQGDGKVCLYKGICNINNGGCNLLARCLENPGIGEAYVRCVCPPAYVGNGIGASGCTRSLLSPCNPNPCIHGTCVSKNITQEFTCICQTNYYGERCDSLENHCVSNPCLNGGTCLSQGPGFSCKCVLGYYGNNCEKERQACGGSIYQENGTLSYPPEDFDLSSGSQAFSCAWTIKTQESMVITVQFKKFTLAEAPCTSEWFQIHDGKNSLANPLGRFCGKNVPFNGTVDTTHNVVYFWLKSDGRFKGKPEFEISWTSHVPYCGGTVRKDTGIIQSPGWPGNYPNNRDCHWTFIVENDKRILFHVYSLNIGQNSDCSGDYLRFTSTHHTAGTPYRTRQSFATICNSTLPSPFYSPANLVTVYFHSNNETTYPGFQIGYSAVEGIPGCGGTYNSQDGYIQSVKLSDSSPDRLDCIYEIKFTNKTTIKLEFFELNMASDNCVLSNVAIYEGSSTDAPLIGKYCGSTLPGPITTYSDHILIVSQLFKYEKHDFKLKYHTVCLKKFRDPSKVFASTMNSDLSKFCSYQIEQPLGNIIILNLEFEFMSTRCSNNYVEIRDGDNENSTLIGKYCGEKKLKIESTTNYLYLKEYRTSLFSYFKADYTALDIGCGGLLKNEIGTIAYPAQRSQQYSPNTKCRWLIIAPPGKVIQLTWMTFNIEQSFDCTYDNLQVFDNNTDGMGGSMGKYCGNTLPPAMLTSSNIMTIDFTTDTTIHGDGFLASYTFLKENHVCGGNYFTSAGVIKSPGYPNNYPTNRECIWTINVSPGRQIMLNVTDFNIEAYSSCRYDWLEIRNGGTSASPLLGKYCGSTIPALIPSHANKLYIKFYSDMSRSGHGFKINWSSTTTGCGGTLNSPSGSIISPHYPEPYTKNTDCYWKIIVNAGSTIQVIFADIDLEKHSVCGLDFVELFDGPSANSKSLGRFCSTALKAITSTGNTMYIRFRSDVSFQGRGFNLKYSIVCKNTLTGFGGVIESPNFPNEYPQDQDCEWDIEVPEKNKINITFSDFALERSTSSENNTCQFDYVEISYHTTDDYEDVLNKYGRYCDSNPGLITLNSNRARVHFVSDSLLLGKGFRLEWKLFGCGGILTQLTGTINSPNYPRSYPASVECHWIITVPLGKSIEITFAEIDVEKDNECSYDFVSVYNGIDATYNLISTFCHTTKPITVTSSGNNMFVRFKADMSYQGRGFIAHYSTVSTTCGGQLTSSSGYIYSPNYPKNYNKNDTCEWLIDIDENHVVELEFEDVDLLTINNCSKNYIKVFDGPTQAYPVLATICGGIKPNNTIRSSFNEMFIEFRSSAYLSSKGFKAKYTKGCGAVISTQGSGIIEAKKNIDIMRLGKCTWTIESLDKSKHVTLTITHLDSGDDWCESLDRSFKVYNGRFNDSPLLGQYCGTKIPPTLVSDGSSLHIEMSENIHFAASYSVLDTQCGGVLTSADGFFASPGYPNKYPSSIQCEWTIAMGPGNQMNLNFIVFDLPESGNCNTDYLEIRETNGTGKLLGVYCGKTSATNLTNVGSLWILFKSSQTERDVIATNKGFYGEYSISQNSKLLGSHGFLGSPFYPRAYSGSFGYYDWTITTKEKTRIQIAFKEFSMEISTDESCSSSSLKIFDGMDNEATQLGEFCGYDLPSPVFSTSNVVHIQAEYSVPRLDCKFLLEWTELSVNASPNTNKNKTECASFYTLDDQKNVTIQSPGFPNGYAPNLNCEWIVETSAMNHLKVQFKTVDLHQFFGARVCTFSDTIRLYQKSNTQAPWKLITEFCNNTNDLKPIFSTHIIKLEFKTNNYINGSGFQAVVTGVCGGALTGKSGYIIFDKDHATGSECQWNITVRSGRTIRLNFEKFDMGPSKANECRNHILIRNGMFSDSPFLGIGKYCTLPPQLTSTSNHIYLKYSGNSGIEGFKINYQEVSIQCGDDIALSPLKNFTEISSPNYPNIPVPHTECIWIFRAPPGESLRVDFEERFDLTKDVSCQREYVEIRDGGTEISSLIGKYCSDPPSTLFSTDNMLRIAFFTDTEEPRNGFIARVSLAYCGGTIRGTHGQIEYPLQSTVTFNSNCTWTLKGPVGYYLEITFTKLDLSYSSNCTKEKVHLSEINSFVGNDTDLGSYCGQIIPNKINSKTNEVIINYQSNSADGFALEFKAMTEECGGQLTQETGTIVSPGYPNMNHENRYCMWNIRVPKGRRISIKVEDMDIDFSSHSSFLAIVDGWIIGPKIAFAQEISLKNTYETSDNTGHIIYYARYSSTRRGFRITFTSSKPTVCQGDFNQTSGSISEPKNITGGKYTCWWDHVQHNLTETLAVTITAATNITNKGFCRRTPVSLYWKKAKFTPIALICPENGKTRHILSPYPITRLQVLNYHYYLHFNVSYRTYQCGGVIEGEQGFISSPGFPNNPQNFIECAWHLKINSGQAVKINITTFDLGNDCQKSYLIIYNGGGPIHPRIGKYCENNKPDHVLITQSDQAFIEYKFETGGNSGKGFNLTYEPRIQGCGGIYHDKSRIIETPNYGQDYPNNAECLWEIRNDPGNFIKLIFFDRFNIEQSEKCDKDYVEIFDWKDDQWVSLGKKCGRNIPEEIKTSSNQMRVLFRSNDKVTGGGFRAKWDLHCGGNFTSTSTPQFIVSPNYPNIYGLNLNCIYKIKTKKNSILNINFHDFDLKPGQPKCISDNFTITTLINGRAFRAGQVYCGNTLPKTQRIRDEVLIEFKSDRYNWLNGRGFKFSYTDESCGGNITKPAILESPPINTQITGYSSFMQPRIQCTWKITAPPNQIVVLSIHKLAMSLGMNCLSQAVKVFDGPEDRLGKRLAQLCGKLEDTQPIPSVSNSMLVKLDSMAYNFEGFQAEVYFTYGPASGCGGTINLTESKTISSPNGLSDLDCHWKIVAPNDYKIQLDFTDVHVPAHCGTTSKNFTYYCSCAFVEVRDGGGPMSELMAILCSSASARSFTTSWNTAYVRLFAAGTHNDVFKMTLKPIQSKCGPSHLSATTDLQTLTSPNYPDSYPEDIKCTWIIDSPASQAKIYLHFEEFDLLDEHGLQEFNACEQDKLEIIEDPNRQIVLEGYGPSAIHTSQVKKFIMYNSAFAKHAFCGKEDKPFDYYSGGNSLTVSFKTFASTKRGKGFKLQYGKPGCNRTLNANEGRIISDDKNQKECFITITSDTNTTLSIYFLTFYTLRGHTNCSDTGIEVRENDSAGKELLRACGFRVPNPVFSSSNKLYIHTYNKQLPVISKVDLIYVANENGIGCGGKLYNYKGKFSSPMYPNVYRTTIDCTWDVKVPVGNKVALKISEFDISGECELNKLVVTTYNGLTSSDHEYCPQDTPAVLFSDLMLSVRYYSSVNNGGTGWLALFQSVKDESEPLIWF